MWLAELFSPAREHEFLALLKRHSTLLTQAAQTLHQYVERGTAQLASDVETIKKKSDECLVDLTTALKDAFVTPMDRQDIYFLGEAIDDMIDYLNSAASEIAMFKVAATEPMLAMTAALQTAAEAIDAGVAALKTQPEQAWTKARLASKLEDAIEDRYRQALAELFEESDVHKIFKLREVYRHLSNSADRADAIASLIGKIVVKET